jgi:hypothetical protein
MRETAGRIPAEMDVRVQTREAREGPNNLSSATAVGINERVGHVPPAAQEMLHKSLLARRR